ncbi:MAG: DUF1579 family protein [Planctomycetes bacterium]|nr:DUF1579 family protein [Planctomycetota bacterium]
MKRVTTVASLLALCSVGLMASAFAQPAKDMKDAAKDATKNAEKTAKDAANKAAQPAKDAAKAPNAEEAAMMEAWTKAATPGKMHERLAKGVGTWEGKCKSWMAPGATPEEWTCTSTVTSILGGRFTTNETKGMMSMGGPPMPFEGHGTAGYNNTTQKFESTWMDNMGTMTLFFTGTLDADGTTITTTAHFTDCITNKETHMKNVEKITGPDTMTLEMYAPGPDGKEFKMMEIAYTRKGGEKAGEKAKH